MNACTTLCRASAKALAPPILSACALLVAASPPGAFAATPTPSIPATPAGHALGSWLAAFNSGNRDRIESFDKVH